MTNSLQNNPILDRLGRLYVAKKLAHAYLFVGPQMIGKTQTALELAKIVNCETPQKNSSCGKCASCLKIGIGNHPDIYVLQCEEGESIKLDDIRQVLERAQLMPFEGKIKVFIIRDIDKLTQEAANALLKTLEEPPKSSLLILTTALPEACLETIKSRCHKVNFYPLGHRNLANRLENDYHVPIFEAGFLAYFADGSLGQAREFYSNKFFGSKNETLDHFLYSSKLEDYLKKISADKVQMKQALSVLYSFFRDCMLSKLGANPMNFVHQDRIKDIHNFEARFSFEDLTSILNQIVHASKLAKENLNVKMSLNLIKEMI